MNFVRRAIVQGMVSRDSLHVLFLLLFPSHFEEILLLKGKRNQ